MSSAVHHCTSMLTGLQLPCNSRIMLARSQSAVTFKQPKFVELHCARGLKSARRLKETGPCKWPFGAVLSNPSTRQSKERICLMSAATEGTESRTGTADQAMSVESTSEEQLDQKDVHDVLQILDLLKEKRDMVFNEVRLTIMVEDPREAERKRQLGIDDESGVTREELGDALLDVYEGRTPQDRLALRALAEEMRNWPRLDDEDEESGKKGVSPYAKVTNTGVDPKLAARRAGVDADWDAAAETPVLQDEKSLGEILPSWMGYGVLYGISFIPIVIGVVVVVILFLNSLQ